MKTLSKLDELFNQLNEIERSNERKKATFSAIEKRLSKRVRKFVPIIIGAGALAISLVFTLLTMTNGIQPTSTQLSNSSNPYAKMLNDRNITRSYVSKSVSAYSFSPGQINRSSNPVAIIDDDKRWNESLKDILLQMKEIKHQPSKEPGYDLMIYLNDEITIKFKIWINDQSIIFKDFTTNTFYTIKSKEAKGFGYILNHMTMIR
ncbi:hypothetical protein [Heyndrickxia vini]|uniref:Uncharacterized protein n=1 Tax=Heyndrickxia vini TaxID=1476025 RepID=A0ABX7E0Q5_9BACI|nr:hypothetical protein [Heyndrickxia vini]QQZ09316.1 hypothetical protein I5776_20540 [Heyndrickxia vini]